MILRSLVKHLIPNSTSSDTGPERILALLDEDTISLLSASSCDPNAVHGDTQALNNIREALAQSGESRHTRAETIRMAQRHLNAVEARATPLQRQTIAQVLVLFQTRGLSIFPVVFIDGRLAFHSGVPSPEMIRHHLLSSNTLAPTATLFDCPDAATSVAHRHAIPANPGAFYGLGILTCESTH